VLETLTINSLETPKDGRSAMVSTQTHQLLANLSQKTLSQMIDCEGVGLHSGKCISLRLVPAAADTGIIFRRTDVPAGQQMIPARYDNVVDTKLCTVISNEYGVKVGTIEHVMAALWAAEVDNVIVEVDGPEVPIMDGSSAPFLFLMQCAGVQEQDTLRSSLKVTESFTVVDGDKKIEFHPSETLKIDFEIDFDSKAIGKQTFQFDGNPAAFRHDLARARTFGFAQEVEWMRQNGLARGGSLENAVVVDGDTILNPEGLRYTHEFVRHKILDLIGDFYLAGAPIVAHIKATKAGHDLNNKAVHALHKHLSECMAGETL